MKKGIQKMRDFYAIKPGAPVYMREFGFYCLDAWAEQGHIKRPEEFADREALTAYLDGVFGFDVSGTGGFWNLGWAEAAFFPCFEDKVLHTDDEYEIVQDFAGRHVKCFKGRRNGFMPEYIDHPVKDMRSWEEQVKWRMNPESPERLAQFAKLAPGVVAAAAEGNVIRQVSVGGYMFLSSLIGPVDLLYKFYDEPELIHACMQGWFELTDRMIAKAQKVVTLDELFLTEDICYNHGPLISLDMIREFLFPYYQQLLANIKSRQLDKNRTLHFQVDTDGFCDPVIDLYAEIGMDFMNPFEVASGCDVVRTAAQYPELRILGGIDKRILASTLEKIDRELERIMPVMRARGGYIPTCDHCVPTEVSFENYMHYRQRMIEYCE